MAVPTFKVEIGWTSAQAGLLIFGFSDFKAPTTYAVTNKALTSNVATLTVPGHPFSVGDVVFVSGVDATFNGVDHTGGGVTAPYVVTATSSTTISYALTAANVTSQSASGTVALVKTADVFGNAFSNFFNGAQDDVTNDVQSIRIKRGRDDILSQINAGTCELELMRPSDRSYWNPANKSSTINTSNAPGFVPMRPVRITATYGGTTYGLFWGFIRSARFDYASGVCRISCVDLMLQMAKTEPLDPGLSTTNGASSSSAYAPDTGTASDVASATVTGTSKIGLLKLTA